MGTLGRQDVEGQVLKMLEEGAPEDSCKLGVVLGGVGDDIPQEESPRQGSESETGAHLRTSDCDTRDMDWDHQSMEAS